MRSSRVFWAGVLVVLGVLLLLSNLGFIRLNIWNLFWPTFLILLGIWFLIGTSRGTSDLVMEDGSIDLQGATSASVVIKHGAGMLEVKGVAETGKLVSGTFANGLDAGAKDLSHIRSIVNAQSQNAGHQRRQDDAQAGQSQVPDKDLHQQGRSANQRDVKARDTVGDGISREPTQSAQQGKDHRQDNGNSRNQNGQPGASQDEGEPVPHKGQVEVELTQH